MKVSPDGSSKVARWASQGQGDKPGVRGETESEGVSQGCKGQGGKPRGWGARRQARGWGGEPGGEGDDWEGEDNFILDFRLTTTCDQKKFDYNIWCPCKFTEWQKEFVGPHHHPKILGKKGQSTTQVTVIFSTTSDMHNWSQRTISWLKLCR